MKQAASRPARRCPAGVRLLLDELSRVEPCWSRERLGTSGSSSRLVMLLASERPIRNSIDR